MDFIEWFIRTAENITKHGLNVQTIIISFMALYNVRVIRKILRKRIPKRYRIFEEDRLERIESQLKAIMEHLGVSEWAVPLSHGRPAPSSTDGPTKSFSSSQTAKSRVRTIASSIRRMKAIYQLSRRFQKMKSKLLSRKFIIAVVSAIGIILNDGLGWGIDQNTINIAAGIIATWILAEAGTDIAKKPKEANYDNTGLDAERHAAEDA